MRLKSGGNVKVEYVTMTEITTKRILRAQYRDRNNTFGGSHSDRIEHDKTTV